MALSDKLPESHLANLASLASTEASKQISAGANRQRLLFDPLRSRPFLERSTVAQQSLLTFSRLRTIETLHLDVHLLYGQLVERSKRRV